MKNAQRDVQSRATSRSYDIDALMKVVRKALGVPQGQSIDIAAPLKALGLTSLGAIALQYQLSQLFGLIVPLETMLGDKPFCTVLDDINEQCEAIFGGPPEGSA
jgi:acyl carrier protein